MGKILLNDILGFSQNQIPNVRIKLNVHNGSEDPHELYLQDPEKVNTEWFLWHKERRYFHKGQIAICLLYIDTDTWLLTTIKDIQKELDVEDGIGYDAAERTEYKKYFGRIKLKYHNKTMGMGRKYESIMEELEVMEILPSVYDGDEFPGYENVRVSYAKLEAILSRKKASWLAALQNQKAVYLLTDTNTGKHYVGSATAQRGMLLQRWKAYVENGHGGNVELQELIKEKGFDYIKRYFQYAILENYNARMDDAYILSRESWWKETLQTRRFGYNGN
ncbi:GIY-YIG nuclease family protein [Anaerotignum sp.]